MSTSSHRPHATRSIRRRRRLGRWALTVGIAAVCSLPAIGASASTSVDPARACSVTPAADSQPFGAYLVGMYRMRDGSMEVLHRVECTDHSVGYVWIPSNII
jgi:hypothetical protein